MVDDGMSLDDFLPTAGAADDGDGIARAGTPIDPAVTPVAAEETIVEALKTVHDPEIPVNIYDLGLIYELEIASDGNVRIEMTLTAPACPVAGILPGQVAQAAAGVDGVGEVEVTLVWDPPWGPEKISEDARMVLGLD